LAHGEILHRVERKVTMRKKKNNSKFGNGEMFEIYSTSQTIFGDIIQFNEKFLRNDSLRKLKFIKIIICCVETFRA
jgi:hypothetical protein